MLCDHKADQKQKKKVSCTKKRWNYAHRRSLIAASMGATGTICIFSTPLALFHASVNACAILVRIAHFLWFQLFALPNLIINFIDLAWMAFTNASSPVLALGVAFVAWTLAAL